MATYVERGAFMVVEGTYLSQSGQMPQRKGQVGDWELSRM
jgi:hypothetical protein